MVIEREFESRRENETESSKVRGGAEFTEAVDVVTESMIEIAEYPLAAHPNLIT